MIHAGERSSLNDKDTRIIAVAEPLDDYHIDQFWKLLGEGYMPIGRMSFTTYPKYIDLEGYKFSRMKYLMNPRMQDVIKTFVGWFAFSDDADQYLDSYTPRITLPNSDTEWFTIERTLGKNKTFPPPN